LDAQAERLSAAERDVITRLGIEREPVSVAELSADMAPRVGRSTVIEAIENLRRRSLVERGELGATFTLQSMMLEYVTDRLVESVVDEIMRDEPDILVEQPLIKAQAKDYVRQMQERLIGTPILQRLNAVHAEARVEPRLLALLDRWRDRPEAEQGYGPGNVINLLRLLRGDLRRLNLSRLAVRQAYLQEVEAQDATLAGSHLTEVVLADALADPTAVDMSAHGDWLAAGTTTGEVRLWSAADRALLLSAQGHSGAVWGISLSGDGRLVASGGVDGMIKLWSLAGVRDPQDAILEMQTAAPGGGPVAAWAGHAGEVRGVALSHDGALLASCGGVGLVKLWSLTGLAERAGMLGMQAEAPSGRLLAELYGHTGTVLGLALAPDGRSVASGGLDETVRLWEVPSGRLLAELHGHTGLVLGLAFSSDRRKARIVDRP
jgi:hypothetical protein